MEPILSAPCTPAQRQRDVLLGAQVLPKPRTTLENFLENGTFQIMWRKTL